MVIVLIQTGAFTSVEDNARVHDRLENTRSRRVRCIRGNTTYEYSLEPSGWFVAFVFSPRPKYTIKTHMTCTPRRKYETFRFSLRFSWIKDRELKTFHRVIAFYVDALTTWPIWGLCTVMSVFFFIRLTNLSHKGSVYVFYDVRFYRPDSLQTKWELVFNLHSNIRSARNQHYSVW